MSLKSMSSSRISRRRCICSSVISGGLLGSKRNLTMPVAEVFIALCLSCRNDANHLSPQRIDNDENELPYSSGRYPSLFPLVIVWVQPCCSTRIEKYIRCKRKRYAVLALVLCGLIQVPFKLDIFNHAITNEASFVNSFVATNTG